MSRCHVFWIFLLLASVAGCGGTPDPREPAGAIRYMADAVEQDAPQRIFRVIDPRSRHAMVSIVQDRRAAAATVREHYPEGEQARALARLGDAAEVEDAAGLFARRCDVACRRELGRDLAAPDSVEGDELDLVVRTARGTTLHLHRLDPQGWWGFVWRTDELDEERSRAAEERRAIEANAAIYDRGRALLEAESEP